MSIVRTARASRAHVAPKAAGERIDGLIGVRYDDIAWRMQILASMREQFGPRWAFLTGTDSTTVGVGKMFRVFSEIEGLEVGLFADRNEALSWLSQRPQT